MLDDPDPNHGRSWLIARTHKDSFRVGDSRLKVSTIHSFKGWDANRVIFVVPGPRAIPSQREPAAIYVGMTRSIDLSVFIIQPGAYGLDNLGLPDHQLDLDPGVEDAFRALLEAVKRGAPAARPARKSSVSHEEQPLWDDWPMINDKTT